MTAQTAIPLPFEEVRQTIARLVHQHMDVPPDQVLADTPFKDLHPDFDSLTLLEMQLLLEKVYGFELQIDTNHPQYPFPANASLLAREVVRQHGIYLNQSTSTS